MQVKADLDQLGKVGVGDVSEANQGFPELAPVFAVLLLLEEQLQLLLHLPMQLL